MNISREDKKQEALKRLHVLAEKFDLGPKLEDYFREDRLYYSYGYSMDTIHYEPRYAEAVTAFERMYHGLVYHVVEAELPMWTMVSFLYVSDYADDWPAEQPDGSRIMAYSFIVENGWSLGEFEDILLAAPQGYLMQVG